MSAAIDTRPGQQASRHRAVDVHPVTLPRVIQSEWIKLRTLRSTFWTYGVAIVMWVGFSTMTAWAFSSLTNQDGTDGVTVEVDGSMEGMAASLSAQGIQMVQLVVVILGVLFITGEYSTGMIRSTFSAVPRRLDALWAKIAVLSVVTFAVGLVGAFASYYVQAPFLNEIDAMTSLGDPHQLRILVGAALYLTIAALLAFGLGTIIRNTAGGVAAVIGVLLVLPILTSILPQSWSENISPWLPANAGAQIILPPDSAATLGNWQGLGVFFAYAVVAIVVGAILTKKRDA